MFDLLDKMTKDTALILEDQLVGIYLHGSIAMDCFNPNKSDLDLLFIVKDSISDGQKRRLMEAVVALNAVIPAKGVEMSVVKKRYCTDFVYPTPFELHFSTIHLKWYESNPDAYIEQMNGVDPDLAAHFVITKNRGLVLYGESIDNVFGEIPSESYLDSIKRDVANSEQQVLANPLYIILNLCRVLAFVEDNMVLSKQEGGQWGIKNLDKKYHDLVHEALVCYVSDKNFVVDEMLALDFCHYMALRIEKNSNSRAVI